MFQNSGMVLLTNAKEEENGNIPTRSYYALVKYNTGSEEPDINSKTVHIRKNFITTFLWETFDMEDEDRKVNRTRDEENTTQGVMQGTEEVTTTIQNQVESDGEDKVTGFVNIWSG